MPLTKTQKRNVDHAFSLIPREKLLALYAALLKCSMLEEFLREKARGRQLAHAEAAAVAAAIDLRSKDTMVAAAGEVLPAFVKSGNLDSICAASCAGQPASFAARIKTALAAGRKNREEQKQKIVAVFGGNVRADLPTWRNALRAAGAERLPMLFVRHAESAEEAAGDWRYGFPAMTVDRDDAVAIYRVVSEAMAHARRGNGPTLIECVPWILADAPAAGAIAAMERYLTQSGISIGRSRARVQASFQRKLRVLDAARSNRAATAREKSHSA